ncbi:Uncharacterised protein [Legionella busanensis]|uniref:Stress-induced bacterial acidophilic repeat motif n=1 Tax=Legionella busanensis TaxID=190655 RepID=A0A378JJL0_9GAMM|nr:hypothetical protein [Legionella busanensis]STX50399.1 Uncharacterised protein [Legionella busanensis]
MPMQGRGSNLSKEAKSKGGAHSHGGKSTSSRSSNLSKEAKSKGGKSSKGSR